MEMEKNSAGKKSVFGSVIAAVCIVIYLGALVYASVSIYLSIEQREKLAEQEFAQIARVALTSGAQGFMDDQFIQTINDSLKAASVIEAIIITGADGEYAFEKNKGHAISWVDCSPRFKNKFIFSDQRYYLSLDIHDVRNANIKAIAGAFNFSEFSNILKTTLLIILVGFALSFFTMLFNLLLGRTEKTEPITYPNNAPPIPAEDGYTPAAAIETGPKGLYSGRSNIGWEEYTKERLDSELHRCASTEKDLALLLMEFTGLTNDSMFAQAAEEAVKFFTSRDLVFEYGKHGITIIMPSVSLDAGIAKAEKFYQRINEKFSQNESSYDLCIGLSSRSGRLLNADRLMMETKEALKKAKNDSKISIIAFRSDPDKYRAFIASQN